MGRSPCCSKEGLNRGAWTALEDKILTDYIKVHGEGRWRNLPKRAGLKRCGKSCRLRWLNYLRPDIKRGNISADEEELIIKLHKLLGNRWSLIAGRLPGRTDNEIKNYWNTNLSKRVSDRQKSPAAPSKKPEAARRGTAGNGNANGNGSGSSSTHVVRTRATRCSKVFINPHHYTQNRDPKPSSTCSNNGDHGESKTMNELLLPIMCESENEGTTDHISSDFTFDFNMGEFCLSDLLNSDFCDVSELNYSKGFDSSPSPDQPPLDFSDEMLKEWTAAASTHCSHQSVASNLQSLPPFLENGIE
ncbi:hypothetical protein Goshw_013007 [Gossypium schwendimanii]|uniref:Myb-related protein 123 n=3 Tax=Gossypium TaxID=3633 RepID=A0A7J9MBC7_GOSSC|nr:hypothetical protein [Gossypium lobatum]MBA0722779.1 hypothetical protein [Gossypium laxum]MBA0868413.1 hypothetical protein [Gossypium schwendimanii]